jgi:NAD(P)H dehydrogenase (quinone)
MSNILIVFAHPEPKSLNGALKDHSLQILREQGHEVQISDLYAMKWKAVADEDDFLDRKHHDRFNYNRESSHAFNTDTQTADIAAEQAKLRWADAVIFQFPLWWFSMPAILKGWFDRVYARGFAYAVGTHGGGKFGVRYGEGTLQGKRAMLAVTIGGKSAHYSERGINGAWQDLLFHINHGMLFYPGMSVLEPFLLYESVRLTNEAYPAAAQAYASRLRGLFTDRPIEYRKQNTGDYDEEQVLRAGLGRGSEGTRIHVRSAGEIDPERATRQTMLETAP